MAIGAETDEHEIEAETKGLIVRRRKQPPGDKIVIRLSPDVPRDADLYDLLREGVTVELIDIEQNNDRDPVAVFGIKAHEAFRIDRDERVLRPRPENERAKMPDVRVPIPDPDTMARWTTTECDHHIAELTTAQGKAEYYLRLLKRDLHLASERGWNLRSNKNHMDWLMIREEILILKEQLSALKARLTAVKSISKKRNLELTNESHAAMSQRFQGVAKRMLDEETFRKIASACTD